MVIMRKKKTLLFIVLLLFVPVLTASAKPKPLLQYVEETFQGWIPKLGTDYHTFNPLQIKVKMKESYLYGGLLYATNVFIRKQGGPTYFDGYLHGGESTSWYSPDGANTACDFLNNNRYLILWYKADVCMYVN